MYGGMSSAVSVATTLAAMGLAPGVFVTSDEPTSTSTRAVNAASAFTVISFTAGSFATVPPPDLPSV
jgi:hypothetical protein